MGKRRGGRRRRRRRGLETSRTQRGGSEEERVDDLSSQPSSCTVAIYGGRQESAKHTLTRTNVAKTFGKKQKWKMLSARRKRASSGESLLFPSFFLFSPRFLFPSRPAPFPVQIGQMTLLPSLISHPGTLPPLQDLFSGVVRARRKEDRTLLSRVLLRRPIPGGLLSLIKSGRGGAFPSILPAGHLPIDCVGRGSKRGGSSGEPILHPRHTVGTRQSAKVWLTWVLRSSWNNIRKYFFTCILSFFPQAITLSSFCFLLFHSFSSNSFFRPLLQYRFRRQPTHLRR